MLDNNEQTATAICYRCGNTRPVVRFPMNMTAQTRKYGRFDWMHEVDICKECAVAIVGILDEKSENS